MNEFDPHSAPDVFLAHSAWVKRLARRLLDDKSAADDLAQDVWLVLRRQPAGTVRDLRAWLRGVVHRLALRRGQHALSRREVPHGEFDDPLVPSTADVLEAEAVRRRVVEAVLSLDEPYRATLLLHFYEDLSAVEIGRRQNIPNSTVRTRIQRGLDRVRTRLGVDDPRTTDTSRGMLAALADRYHPPVSTPWDQFIMAASSTKVALGGIVLVVLCAGLVWLLPVNKQGPPEVARLTPLTSDASSKNQEQGQGDAPTPTERQVGTPTDLPATPKAEDERWHLALERPEASVRGTVIRADDSSPVPSVNLRLSTSTGNVAHNAELADDRAAIVRDATTDANGTFHFDRVPLGAYRLEAKGAGGLQASEDVAAVANGSPVLITLKRAVDHGDSISRFAVRTLDDARRPLADLELQLSYRDRIGLDHERTSRSDAQGYAVFTNLDVRTGSVISKTADGRVAHAFVQAGSGIHIVWMNSKDARRRAEPLYELVLRPSGSIEGKVADGSACIVHAWPRDESYTVPVWPRNYRASCAADGSFQIAGLATGVYMITVDAPTGLRADLPLVRFGGGQSLADWYPSFVEVKSGLATALDLRLVPASVVEGQVLDGATRTPVAKAHVRAWAERPSIQGPGGYKIGDTSLWSSGSSVAFTEWMPSDTFETTTDANGRYQLSGLTSLQTWALEVTKTPLSRERVDPLRLEDGKVTELTHVLEAAGGIEGVSWLWANVGIRREGESRCVDAVGLPHAQGTTFTVTGLKPGRYELIALHWANQFAAVPLTRVDVKAGQLSWVDLRGMSPHVCEGRVVHRGKPVADATLDFIAPGDQLPRTTTDADGRFTLRFPFPSEVTAQFDIVAPRTRDVVRTRVAVPALMSGSAPMATIELPEGELEVQLEDAGGQPVKGEVELQPATAHQFFGNSTEAIEMMSPRVRRTSDAHGHVRFATLQPDRYWLLSESANGERTEPVAIDVLATGTTSKTLRFPESSVVRVRVIDASGNSVPSALVSVSRWVDKREFELAQRISTDDHGLVSFPRVPVGHVIVTASIEGAEVGSPQWAGVQVETDVLPRVGADVTVQWP